jgi:hypothetical protein
LEHEFYFPYFGNVIIPTDELIFFRGVGQPATSINIVDGNIAWACSEKRGIPRGIPNRAGKSNRRFFWCNMGLCKIRVPNPVLAPILLYISPLLGKARAWN